MCSEVDEENQIAHRCGDFVDAMEVVYAVLLAWGFARVVEKFIWEIDYILPMFISGLVLIRFFFAASHNLAPVVARSKDDFFSQRFLFVWDIPFLVMHSFVYYRMCYVLSEYSYLKFYKVFGLLLLINSIWLFTINLRRKLEWSSKWTLNNIIHWLAIIPLIIYFKNTFLLFYIALSNCLLDFFLSAPYYLGFKDIQLSAKKRIFYFLRLYLFPMIIALVISMILINQRVLLSTLARVFQ